MESLILMLLSYNCRCKVNNRNDVITIRTSCVVLDQHNFQQLKMTDTKSMMDNLTLDEIIRIGERTKGRVVKGMGSSNHYFKYIDLGIVGRVRIDLNYEEKRGESRYRRMGPLPFTENPYPFIEALHNNSYGEEYYELSRLYTIKVTLNRETYIRELGILKYEEKYVIYPEKEGPIHPKEVKGEIKTREIYQAVEQRCIRQEQQRKKKLEAQEQRKIQKEEQRKKKELAAIRRALRK